MPGEPALQPRPLRGGVTRGSLPGFVALALLVGAALASATPASHSATATPAGRPPGPSRGGLAPIFQGAFAHPRWGGSIVLALSPDGRTIFNIGGIAPGVCEDEDFGHLVAGQDGATGPTFEIYLPARINANGSFAVAERRKGQRVPFKGARSATVSGTFNGDTVRGTLRASRTTTFDTCTARVSFRARRSQ